MLIVTVKHNKSQLNHAKLPQRWKCLSVWFNLDSRTGSKPVVLSSQINSLGVVFLRKEVGTHL